MTIKKAIQGLDIMIENKRQLRVNLLDSSRSWNKDNTASKSLVDSLTSSLEFDVEVLSGIRTHLLPKQKKLDISCKHSKKDHDITKDGQKYCINCNADL